MAKNKISEFSATPANNTDIGDINIAEGCAPSNINQAIRELMAQLKDQQTGADADPFVVGGGFTCTGPATFSASVVISGSPLGISSGGTALSAVTTGDILYASGTSSMARLATAGTTLSVLLSGNTNPSWGKVSLGSGNSSATAAITGTLSVSNGGTGSGTTTAALNNLLPAQTTNSGKFLKSDGTNASWSDIATSGGSVTSVSSGAGMNFTTITTTGSVVLGTPSTLSTTSTNNVTTTSHTHAVSFPVTSIKGQSSDTALTGDILLSSLESFARSLNPNGYQKLPGGLIIQWGTYNSTVDTAENFSWVTNFSSACYVAIGSFITINSFPLPITSVTNTGFTVDRNGTIEGTVSFRWIAIGQ